MFDSALTAWMHGGIIYASTQSEQNSSSGKHGALDTCQQSSVYCMVVPGDYGMCVVLSYTY